MDRHPNDDQGDAAERLAIVRAFTLAAALVALCVGTVLFAVGYPFVAAGLFLACWAKEAAGDA